jgi:hypothetical protein
VTEDKKSKEQLQDQPKADSPAELSLEDTLSQKARGVHPTAATGKSGYNPYDTEINKIPELEKKKRPTDLRKLSDWIRLKREVEALDKERDNPPSEE